VENVMDNSGATPAGAGQTGQPLPERVADLAGELSESRSASRRRRLAARLAGRATRGRRATFRGARSLSRRLTTEVLAMGPRLPVRNQQQLRAQFPGLQPDELADALIHGAARASAGMGAAAGGAMVLPIAAGTPIAVETLALVAIEVKLIAELHEVYGMRPPGSAAERMMSYLAVWANRGGIGLAPGGLVFAAESPLRRRLERRLVARAGRSATSLGPLLTGAVLGAALNRIETRRIGNNVRHDLRQRLAGAAGWPG
jgi:hypothetical protein